jgi:hypothetical protein
LAELKTGISIIDGRTRQTASLCVVDAGQRTCGEAGKHEKTEHHVSSTCSGLNEEERTINSSSLTEIRTSQRRKEEREATKRDRVTRDVRNITKKDRLRAIMKEKIQNNE